MLKLSSLFNYLFFSFALGAATAYAECSSENLGVSRLMTINNASGSAVGLQSYPQTLGLADHEVVLTFDDGPAVPTAEVLNALAKECVRATFS